MKLSVILSSYNDEDVIQEAVDSILSQSYPLFEFLIVSDGSTDSSAEKLAQLAARDDRIRLFTNSSNIGLTRSLNRALSEARGEYIARMDSDDVAYPSRFEEQVAFLDAHRDIGVVGTTYELIDADDQVIGRPSVVSGSQSIRHRLPRTNPLLHSSVMIRRSLLDRSQGYDEDFVRAQDYDLWLRLLPYTQFENLRTVLMKRRVRSNMISVKNEREQLRCAVRARVRAVRRGDLPLWNLVFVLKPLIASLLPTSLVRWVRIRLFKQTHYQSLV